MIPRLVSADPCSDGFDDTRDLAPSDEGWWNFYLVITTDNQHIGKINAGRPDVDQQFSITGYRVIMVFNDQCFRWAILLANQCFQIFTTSIVCLLA